jgi:hypothetical protein
MPSNAGPEFAADLGEVKLVCRIRWSTLVWSSLLAAGLCGCGIAGLILLLRSWVVGGSGDVLSAAFYLALIALLLWAGWRVGRHVAALRHKQVVVRGGGLAYHDGAGWLTCRWDEVGGARWSRLAQYEQMQVAWGVPIPGTESHSHTSNRIVVLRKDGVKMVFTDEMQDVVGLALAIEQGLSRYERRAFGR